MANFSDYLPMLLSPMGGMNPFTANRLTFGDRGGEQTIKGAEWLGKALPNEISKLSPWLQKIPVYGWIGQALGAADTGATTFADIYKSDEYQHLPEDKRAQLAWEKALSSGIGSYMGGGNPGVYGSQGNIDRNWADYLGMAGSLYGGLGNTFGGNKINAMGALGLLGTLNNIYGAASGSEDRPNYGIPGTGTQASLMDYLPLLNFMGKTGVFNPLKSKIPWFNQNT